jgi:tRNA (guanine-N7-)-methyltransferase
LGTVIDQGHLQLNGTDSEHDRVRREVTSFVRRSTRMRPQQRRAWEQHYDRFVVPVPRAEARTSVDQGASVDLKAAFGRSAPLIVEIGPGAGDSLVPMAQARPADNVLAFEVYQPAIASMLAQLATAGVSNVRIMEADAVAGLRHLVPPGSVDEVWMFFPDPWHKARHRKRRLLSTDFADLVASRMRSGGILRLATDWEDYAGQMRGVLDHHPAFSNEHRGSWAPRWEARPITRFERRAIAAGRQIFDLAYRRV